MEPANTWMVPVQIVLSDHDCEGQAEAIFKTLDQLGYSDWLPIRLCLFTDVRLHKSTDDEQVWRFCQEYGYLLLTGNRTASAGEESLERAIRRLVTPDSLPVLTISNLKRVNPDPDYRRRCAERLAEVIFDLDNYRGIPRLFLPGIAK